MTPLFNQNRPNFSIMIMLFFLFYFSSAAEPSTPDGVWHQFRGSHYLTGISLLKCSIINPEIKWKQFIGARETLFVAGFADEGNSDLILPNADTNTEAFGSLYNQWNVRAPLYDLDNNGKLTPITPSGAYKIGKFLKDHVGLQKVEFDSGFAHPDPDYPLRGRFFTRHNGQWEQIWGSERIYELASPNAIVGDFDDDGNLETACTPWYDLWVLDMATGKCKYKCRFTPDGAESGRAYGWLGAYDLDGDGKQEFIILSDSENHIGVLGWKDGQLVRIWSRLIERGVTIKNTQLQVIHHPVQDVDGDGKPEIAISVFNEHGDSKWHTEIIDGMSGNIKMDIPENYLFGLADINGDETAELFCCKTDGILVPQFTDLSIFSLKDNNLITLWQDSKSSFQSQNRYDLPLNVNSGAYSATQPLMIDPIKTDGLPIFITREPVKNSEGSIELSIWQSDNSRDIHKLGQVKGPNIEAIAVKITDKDNCSLLLHSQYHDENDSHISLSNANGQIKASRRIGVPLSPPVVGRLAPNSSPAVVVQDALQNIVAFHPSAKGKSNSIKWRVAGRGMYTGSNLWGMSYAGVILADLFGDGNLATIAATISPDGYARLIAIDPHGREIWHHDIKHIPGPPPPWNVGGLTFWFDGHFRDPKRSDILVNYRPTNHNEALMLDGRTGEKVWHRAEGCPGGASGGGFMAICDYDHDKLDDALCMWPGNNTFVIDGDSGELLLALNTSQTLNAMCGVPIVADFMGNGELQMLYSGSVWALLKQDGQVIWKKGVANGIYPIDSGILPGVADIDGDGKPELLITGQRLNSKSTERYFICYDSSTGEEKWKMPLLTGSSFSTPCTTDLDGDGKQECIFSIDNTLYAVGTGADGKNGDVRWKLELPGNIGTATIADVDGKGDIQIIAVCSDGYVYGIR